MRYLLYILLFISASAFSQVRRPLQGKIVAGEAVLSGVFVINKATGIEAKTDSSGNFCVDAQVGDRLAVYSTNITAREFAVNAETFLGVPYVMEVTISGYELKEVVINDITSEKLGIVPKGQKQYTPAGKKLRTATDWNMTLGLGLMPGISFALDPIMNSISGRTKMLKKALETENKEFAMEKIDNIYTKEQIVTDLKIPAEYVNGFLFYAVEDAQCAVALKSKNTELAKLQMMVLAEKYIKLIANE